MATRLCRTRLLGAVAAMLLSGGCASGANHTLHELDRMAIVHQPPPNGVTLGTQRDNGTFVGRQAGILAVYRGGTANVFVRIRTGSPWVEEGYTIKPKAAPSDATTFVTVLLLGVPD